MERLTVLVVDDDPDTRVIWRAVLQHHGYLVLQAVDGAEGVRTAMARDPDVVVMDLEMPGLDGLQATRHLKEHRLTSAMPVIVVSAHAGAEYRKRAEEAGCDGYLAKPCPPAELLGEVERVLGGLLATAERR